ncbi:MAG TPA: hypothetical protein VFT38_15845 [Vicinamibacteria bacterium]|nr:hypothetical protein [Vicinamibacteria bacterium]
MRGGRSARLALAVLALVQAACFVEIHHVRDPAAAFRKARAQAQRDQSRPGRAHRLNVLAFDAGEGKLVRVSLPIWLARKIEGHIDLGEEGGRAMERSVGRSLARQIHVQDLAAAGRGLIADVEDDDGQVLVWLR